MKLYRIKDTESNRYLDFSFPCEVRDVTKSSALEWDAIVKQYCYWRRLYKGDVYAVVDADTDNIIEVDPALIESTTDKLLPDRHKKYTTLVFNGLISEG